MKIYRMPQRSDEWFDIRKGKMTASNAQAIAVGGKGLETYVYSILAEKYSNNRDSYINSDIERGIEQEEQARMTYEIENEEVDTVGFLELDEYVGCSPDGLVGDDGGLEIKCPNNVNYFKLMLEKEKAIDSKYIWQVQTCLYISARKWWDLAFYNANFDKNLLIFRIKPEMAKQEQIIIGLEKGKKIIKELEQKYADRKI